MKKDVLVMKEGIEINEFDTCSDEQVYLLSFNEKKWQISEYMYGIIKLIDGKSNVADIASSMSEELGGEITEENILKAVNEFLVKRGLLVGTEDLAKNNNPGIAKFFWLKIPLLRSGFIQKLKFLCFLYHPLIMKVILFVILTSFVFAVYRVFVGKIDGFKDYNYLYTLIILGISTWIHEFGHSCACMRYGLKPGNIGFAFYFTFPVLYSDVSSSWSLKRNQRVMVDCGGIYFELIFLCVFFITGVLQDIKIFEFTAIIGFMSVLTNLNPIIKMDGYWILSDLLGIPNLHVVSIEFFKNSVKRLFRLRPTDVSVVKIGRRQKLLFGLYSVVFNLFLYVMLFFTLNYLVNVPQYFYEYVAGLLENSTKDLKSFGFAIFNIAAFVITIILMLRVTYYTAYGLIRMILDIVKSIWREKSLKQG